jgi:hypothetical protein
MMFYRLLPDKAGDKRFYPREADLPTHPADGLLRVIRRMRRHVSNVPKADPNAPLTSGDALFILSTKGRRDIESTRAIDNRPMSSRSQALFHSVTEMEHVQRQHHSQSSQQSRSSFSLVSGPQMVLA